MNDLIEDITYSQTDFTIEKLPKGDYEGCTFTQCNFSNADVSNSMFIDCEFVECDFSSANLAHSTFKESNFINCKMIGLHFSKMSGMFFSARFELCNLSFSSFVGRNLQGIQLIACSLKEVDFSDSDLKKVTLDRCDLHSAIFENTHLEGANFTSSFNFSIDPEKNMLKKAKFSKENVSGLLTKYNLIIE